MKLAAIGIRVHSGWGALVVVSGVLGAEEIVDRRRIAIADPKMAGAIQPYHFAERLELNRAEQHVAKCGAASQALALAALREVAQHVEGRGYRIAASCVLLSLGRPLPELNKILASHAMIHTAEGEFFREAFRQGLKQSGIPVTGIRERELQAQAECKFGKTAAKLQKRIAGMGRSLGPPWTTDQKSAALGAFVVLPCN